MNQSLNLYSFNSFLSSAYIALILILLLSTTPSLTNAAGGQWQLLQKSIGISAMHMQLLSNDRVVIFDRTDFGKSNLSLPNGKCRNNDLVLKIDCTAHSAEYNIKTDTFRPLFVQTDVWCSSGSLMSDGRLIQTGGFNSGERKVRIFNPCSDCDWQEIDNGLNNRRWYATNHLLPDGRQIIIGGRGQFNYEFYPKSTSSLKKTYTLDFLAQTNDLGIENNLYPFVFLNPDGNLFIFANNRAILLNYVKNQVVKTYPTLPGGDPRSYPSTGSAVLLPLKNIQAGINTEAEVLVCGGAPKGSFTQANNGKFIGALKSCGRIKITDPNPQWVMEDMPLARVMGDMILLPNGHVIIINGASSGLAGWELGRNPVLSPVLYQPDNQIGSRFKTQNPSTIPRMYHSTAILLRDGRVLVGGSNPHVMYNFKNVLFPTELSLEAFNPQYLNAQFLNLKPTFVLPRTYTKLKHGQKLIVHFRVSGQVTKNKVKVTMVSPSFTTHSYSMNQRLLVLNGDAVKNLGRLLYEIQVTMPSTPYLAPSGFYLLFVVHQDIPSEGIWIQLI